MNKINITSEEFVEMNVGRKMRLTEIAKLYSVHPDTLSKYVRNILGVKVIAHRKTYGEIISPEMQQKIIDEYIYVKSTKAVVQKLGVSRRSVFTTLNNYGIDIKSHKNMRQSCVLSGRLTKTLDEYKELCRERNIQVNEYFGSDKHSTHLCLICNTSWETRPLNILQYKHGCPTCAVNKRRLSSETYIDRLAEYCPNLEALEDYKSYFTKILHRCKTCSFTWKTLPIHRTTESGCRQCCVPGGTESFGKRTQVGDLYFDSILESKCYLTLLKFFNPDKIIHKKWYKNYKYCSDFYIPDLDLWIEVSNFNTADYLEKIYSKRQLVENFVFFTDENQIEEYFTYKGENNGRK